MLKTRFRGSFNKLLVHKQFDSIHWTLIKKSNVFPIVNTATKLYKKKKKKKKKKNRCTCVCSLEAVFNMFLVFKFSEIFAMWVRSDINAQI